MFNKKCFISFILVFLLLSVSDSFAAPKAPDKGQWAFALMKNVRLYSRPDENSKSINVSFNERWIKVLAAQRDENNDLWYKIKINGRQGWISQTGIRLKMGGKNKRASNIYKLCSNVRRKVMNGSLKGWTKTQNDNNITYSSKNGSFTIRKNGRNFEDLYFTANGARTCTTFLGFNAIGMDRNSLRQKLGSPTMRETPPDEPDVNILSYELADRNMTLSMHLRRSYDSPEATVEFFELYRGKTGDNFSTEDFGTEDFENQVNYDDDWQSDSDSSDSPDVPDDWSENY